MRKFPIIASAMEIYESVYTDKPKLILPGKPGKRIVIEGGWYWYEDVHQHKYVLIDLHIAECECGHVVEG